MDHSDPVEPKDGYVKTSLTWEQLSLLKRSMSFESEYADRMTLSFAYQLWTIDREHGDGASILREIAALEGAGAPTGTKPEERFKKPPLDRFWHKHFFSPRHINRNIGIRWGVEHDRNGNRALDGMIQSVAHEHGHDPDLWPKKITHEFVIEGLIQRSAESRLTGDWIVYAKHGGLNYYLSLATHEQGRDDPQSLVESIEKSSAAEFPFLFQ